MCEIAMNTGREANSRIISDLAEENKRLKTGLTIDTSFKPGRVPCVQSARNSSGKQAQYKVFSPSSTSSKGKRVNVLKQLEGMWLNRQY